MSRLRANEYSQSAEQPDQEYTQAQATGQETFQQTEDEPRYDSDSDSSDEQFVEEKPKSKRPPNNAFTQQRLKAYNPVFTARTIIPLLITIAIVFTPLGAAMWYAAHRVQDITIDYSQCELLASTDYWSEIPGNYTFHFNSNSSVWANPQWKLDTDDSQPFEDERKVCRIQFSVPTKLNPPIFLFYRLKKFHMNHRRYAKSFSEDQLNGKPASLDTIKNTVGQNCEPLSTNSEGKKYYPCGLIANSLFNDTIDTTLVGANGTTVDYVLSDQGIAWSTDKNRFKKTRYNYTEVVPPPNWYKQFPNGYNETNMPDISTWYQFQNWMRTAALPDFVKLALKNTKEGIEPGIYEIKVGLHWPVLPFNGQKFIYISQRSAIGGKNVFLGISWMAGGGLCFLLGLLLLVVNLIKPRKTGDVNMLSWNKEKIKQDEQAAQEAS